MDTPRSNHGGLSRRPSFAPIDRRRQPQLRFVGWLVQRQLTSKLTLGAEIFRETAKEAGAESDTKFNVGTIFDLSDTCHLLLSAGHTFPGPGEFQAYGAFQITFGPKEERPSSNK